MIKKTIQRFKNLPNRIFRKIGFEIKKVEKRTVNKNDLSRLSQFVINNQPVKLHFGCGPRVLKGWVNIDLAFEPFEDYLQYYTDIHYPENIRGDRNDFYEINFLKTGLPLLDDSVDVIFHEDFFEHLTQKEQVVFLAETLRVMKKGSTHRINTPNLLASMRDNSNFRKGREGVFTDEWENWHHFSIVTPAILEEMAKMVGYSDIKFNAKNNSVVADLLPREYRPDEKDRPARDSNVFADLIK
jgi:predicted SAM-dependent methyltransferase